MSTIIEEVANDEMDEEDHQEKKMLKFLLGTRYETTVADISVFHPTDKSSHEVRQD